MKTAPPLLWNPKQPNNPDLYLFTGSLLLLALDIWCWLSITFSFSTGFEWFGLDQKMFALMPQFGRVYSMNRVFKVLCKKAITGFLLTELHRRRLIDTSFRQIIWNLTAMEELIVSDVEGGSSCPVN
ncbi:hypothetical protein L2E82_51886 [Cichorium intybus]|nr:hypothetical protein L2E82_51886 [Cichorium intybus]